MAVRGASFRGDDGFESQQNLGISKLLYKPACPVPNPPRPLFPSQHHALVIILPRPSHRPPSLSRPPRERILLSPKVWSTNWPVNPTTAPFCSSPSSYIAYISIRSESWSVFSKVPLVRYLGLTSASRARHYISATICPLTSRRCRQSIPIYSQWPVTSCTPL